MSNDEAWPCANCEKDVMPTECLTCESCEIPFACKECAIDWMLHERTFCGNCIQEGCDTHATGCKRCGETEYTACSCEFCFDCKEKIRFGCWKDCDDDNIRCESCSEIFIEDSSFRECIMCEKKGTTESFHSDTLCCTCYYKALDEDEEGC
jgi:hypothetical protein